MRDKTKDSKILDVTEAREFFVKMNLNGFVSLIDYLIHELEAGEVTTKVGICVDSLGILNGKFPIEAAPHCLQQINFGSGDGKILPLDDLVLFARRVEKIDPKILNLEKLKLIATGFQEYVSVMRKIEIVVDEDRWDNEGGSPGLERRRLH